MKRLKYNNRRFSLYDDLSSPIVVLSPAYKIEYLNKSAEKIYNIKLENCAGKSCSDFNCSFAEISRGYPIKDVFIEGKSIIMKVKNFMGVSDSDVRAFPVRDDDGKIQAIGIEDFSKLSEINHQVEELEFTFRKIVENAADAIFVLGKNFKIEFANSAALEMLGKSLEEIQELDFRDAIKDSEAVDFIENVCHEESKYNNVGNYFKRNILFGKENLSVVKMCIIKSREPGDNVKTYVFLQNVKENDIPKDELVPSNNILGNIIQHYVDGIMTADMKGNIIFFNKSAEKLLGYSSEEAIKNVHITKVYRPGFAKEIMKMLRSSDYGGVGKLEPIDVVAINKSGEEIPCSLSAVLVYDKYGKEVASAGVFSDLRERKKMLKELEETHLKLVQSEKMSSLGKLAAGIAHEINNPLGGILIFSNMLLEEIDKDDPAKEDLVKIINETTKCKDIVKGLLEFSRQTDSNKVKVDLNRLLEQGMSLLENQAIFHNITIIKDYDNSLPLVTCDSARLSQVFLNLTLNAVDAMGKKGEFRISTKYNKSKNLVEIKFSDTGCGIPEEVIPKIFDPFFTTKEIGKGTGLGLSVSYGIIKDHNGTINVQSRVNEGTTITIVLPAGEQ